MEIVGIGLIVIVLAAALAALLRGWTGRDRRAARPSATRPSEGTPTASPSEPTVDRPAGPAAETHMGPAPGVVHPDSQHDADGGAFREAPESQGHHSSRPDPEQKRGGHA